MRIVEVLRRHVWWFGIICIAALLSSCFSKPESEIVGKWKEIGGNEAIEFFKDGAVSIVDKGHSIGGSYKFIDDDRVKLALGGFYAMAGPVIAKVSFQGGDLSLTMPNRKASKYIKTK